ncbi:hypothetical protein NDU88_004942 [Pleurodeles waltl]|uniref:Uncharacterized protein n=1 Tax=Pleurodeles waltl TaxID=8319 RepID=A0AAV7SKC7_PLEWA|nr:hypothetical protein NDU88_004942 [Pleurodeles waltl]
MTHDFPARKMTTQVRVCWVEIDTHTIFPRISSSAAPLQRFSTPNQGQRPREHRQQAGGALKGILTAVVWPRSERENPPVFRCPQESSTAPPWGFRHPIPPSCSWRFARQEQDGGMGCRGAPGGPTKNFSVCLADTEICDGCNCTRHTFPLRRLHSEPASSWEGVFRWAGGRPSGGHPPAQRETQNHRGGLQTAERCSVGELWRAASAARQS